MAAIIERFFFVLRVPTLFQGLFCSLNGGKLYFEIFIKDLPKDKLTACSALWACAKDRTVRLAEMAFFSYLNVVSEYSSVKIKKSSFVYLR